ncbi:putative transmembrane protein, partial [Rhizoctonia solani 123E]
EFDSGDPHSWRRVIILPGRLYFGHLHVYLAVCAHQDLYLCLSIGKGSSRVGCGSAAAAEIPCLSDLPFGHVAGMQLQILSLSQETYEHTIQFGAMPIILIVGRIAFFRPDMTCIIGLKPFSSLALLSYDLFTNVFLNAMFLWPLLRSKFINLQLRVVAKRTLVAAGAALATSITNVAILTVLKHELGWVCLASCATDVTLNALVIFWLTMPNVDRFRNEPTNRSVQFIGQQLSSFHQKPDTEYIAHKPASIKAPMVTLSTHATHKPRSSLNTTVSGRAVDAPVSCQSMIVEAHEVQYTPTIPDFPVSPTVASTSVGNLSILTGSPGDGSNSGRKSTGLRSLGEFFGLSKQKPEHGMEVHASVATQHDVELGELENVQNKQDDGDSFDQTKSASRCYK